MSRIVGATVEGGGDVGGRPFKGRESRVEGEIGSFTMAALDPLPVLQILLSPEKVELWESLLVEDCSVTMY